MNYRKFANIDIVLSRIGLGCMGMSAAYGKDKDIKRVLQHLSVN